MEQKIAVGAGGWYMSSAVDQSRLMVYAVPRPDVTLEALEKALDAVLDEMCTTDVDAKELQRAKTRLIADTIYAQDSQSSLARMYGSALATGSTIDDVKNWPDAIDKVTAADVKRVAAEWLQRRRAVSGYLLKDEAA
jgi:zinc protease